MAYTLELGPAIALLRSAKYRSLSRNRQGILAALQASHFVSGEGCRHLIFLRRLLKKGLRKRRRKTSAGIPVITGGDETRALLVALTMLGRLYDKLESVVHDVEAIGERRMALMVVSYKSEGVLFVLLASSAAAIKICCPKRNQTSKVVNQFGSSVTKTTNPQSSNQKSFPAVVRASHENPADPCIHVPGFLVHVVACFGSGFRKQSI